MAGIYLHIPFCKTRCLYCDFFTGTDERAKDAFVAALCQEILLRKDEVDEPVKTIYFGGGTPSRLSREQLEQIIETLFKTFPITEKAEITLEANPDDLSLKYIEDLRLLPFNRISIGIQSFHDTELAFLSRRHTAQQAIETVKKCQDIGAFDNISIDLMYGLPGQTLDIWQQNLLQALSLNIQHISAYHLIYEDKTPLTVLLKKGKIRPVSDELSTDMFSMLIDMLTSAGFEHYEIANFARNQRYSRHNTSYWQGEKYVGLGPAAHSFDGKSRKWNVYSLSRYIEEMKKSQLSSEIEILDITTRYNEYILTGLRTQWGVDLSNLRKLFGEELYRYCLENAEKYLTGHLLSIDQNTLMLTREGIFISDGIMSDLMWVK